MAITAGVDLGGTKIQTVILKGNRVAGKDRRQTPQTGANDVIGALAESVAGALGDAGMTAGDLDAIGIGSPGVVDSAAGMVRGAANIPGFEGATPVGPALSAALGGLPVVVDNDVRTAVTGEHKLGAGRPYSDFLGVFVGTGVGGGLVLGGRLRRGQGAAGEIGHTVVERGGRRCPCGRRGCLEAYAGRQAIERQARKRQEEGTRTSLFHIMEKMERPRVTSGVIAQALKEGDRLTQELIDDAIAALGAALASAQNLLDLKALVLGGGLADKLGAAFVERVEAAMKPHIFAPHHAAPLLPSALGDLSGAVGGAVSARQAARRPPEARAVGRRESGDEE